MSKIGLIIKREYLSRVTKRAFILSTFLTPILIGVFGFVVGKIMTYKDKSKVENIAVVDDGNMLSSLKGSQTLKLTVLNEPLEATRARVGKDFTGVLHVPAMADLKSKKIQTTLYTNGKMSFDLSNDIQNAVSKAIKNHKVGAFQLDTSAIAALETKVSIESASPSGATDAKKNSSKTATIGMTLSIFLGLFMYLMMFIYGMMVMRSVMEEKTNRIVEVMISSVRPFELMLGKIVGVGLVGLTQIVAWIGLFFLISTIMTGVFGMEAMSGMQGGQMGGMNQAQMQAAMQESTSSGSFLAEMGKLNWYYIIPLCVFYFLTGYFLYASLFAALGSAIGDDMGEAQSLTLPITIPIIMGLYIAMAAARDPDTNLAVWSSIIPFFSPFVMTARLVNEPPLWQVGLSMVTMIATIVALIWLAGRIYRVGILMYGKKASFKELMKWVFYSD